MIWIGQPGGERPVGEGHGRGFHEFPHQRILHQLLAEDGQIVRAHRVVPLGVLVRKTVGIVEGALLQPH